MLVVNVMIQLSKRTRLTIDILEVKWPLLVNFLVDLENGAQNMRGIPIHMYEHPGVLQIPSNPINCWIWSDLGPGPFFDDWFHGFFNFYFDQGFIINPNHCGIDKRIQDYEKILNGIRLTYLPDVLSYNLPLGKRSHLFGLQVLEPSLPYAFSL